MLIWHQTPKLTPRYFLETPRLFGYPLPLERREKMSTEKLKVNYVVERQSLNAYISY